MKAIRIYLDDERQEPEGWIRTKTAAATIVMLRDFSLRGQKVDELSLDHDLGPSHYLGDYSDRNTGYAVLEWIEDSIKTINYFPPTVIKVHSMNPAGRARMEKLIKRINEMRKYL